MTGVELALLDRSKDAGEHRVRLSPAVGSVAAADSGDDGRAQRVFSAPVGGVNHIGLEQKREHGREFDREMRREAPRNAS